ncbi:ADP/ATP carrier protein, putative [Plasmodium gallinaceum]|uniref:ADP/ATP carrier protein, putative n=1 Tax=Plasmodium gallinaceum TaxID=5849 RepID=A0A1J1GNS2_PLAGA|nr:ADP/ATP carrier protein, putative [Plasmodium gallinaceum]CRG94106.1 ADP/ATP carrier protein, putative [Plasmodium gallinaceum]
MENYYLKKKKKIRYKELYITTFLTHGGSNLISKLIISPLERLVIIKQTQPVLFRNVLVQSSYTYKNIIKSIYINQGLTSFWWGYNANVLNFLSFSFFRLLFHDKIKYILSLENSKNDFVKNFFLLYASSCLAISITYPLDVAHTYMTLNHEKIKNKKLYNRSVFFFIYDQLLKKDIKNLYCGFSLCLLNFIPYLLISTKLNDLFTKYFIEFHMNRNNDELSNSEKRNHINEEYKKLFNKSPSFFYYIFLGVLTGYTAQIVTYPLETIRKKYQYYNLYEKKFPKSLMHYNYLNHKKTKHILNKISNSYKGFLMHSFKLIPEYFIFSFFFYYVKNNMPL